MTDEWPSLAAMTDQWAAEISLDKLVAVLSKKPERNLIELAIKAAFVDGAIRMLEVTGQRVKHLQAVPP